MSLLFDTREGKFSSVTTSSFIHSLDFTELHTIPVSTPFSSQDGVSKCFPRYLFLTDSQVISLSNPTSPVYLTPSPWLSSFSHLPTSSDRVNLSTFTKTHRGRIIFFPGDLLYFYLFVPPHLVPPGRYGVTPQTSN